MAYVSKELKAKIAGALKDVVDKGVMGYSLAVRHHSSIVMTINRLEKAWIKSVMLPKSFDYLIESGHMRMNQYRLDQTFNEEGVRVFEQILAVLNTDNYDRSDLMTDYFDVGHYVDLDIGKWDKPVNFT